MRVLGLDTCRKGEVFGAVIRGGWFLDGVVRFGLGRPAEQQVAENVRATKYYPELRAIMLHDPGNHLAHGLLETVVRLPVIAVSNAREVPKGYSFFRSEHGTLLHRSRLSRSTADQVLSLTWTCGRLPEPARIAHVLAKGALERELGR